MEPAAREGLRRALLSLADGKRLMGIRYSDWLLGAPSIETGIAASSMAQDEWGHARLLYAMLKDFGMDPAAVEHERAAEEYANPEALDEPLADWAAVVAACVIVDGALSVALEGFSEGVYEPTRSRIPKMLDEETFHHDLGVAWFRKLAGGSEEGRSRLREAALSMLARTLAWLTPADEVGEAQGPGRGWFRRGTCSAPGSPNATGSYSPWWTSTCRPWRRIAKGGIPRGAGDLVIPTTNPWHARGGTSTGCCSSNEGGSRSDPLSRRASRVPLMSFL